MSCDDLKTQHLEVKGDLNCDDVNAASVIVGGDMNCGDINGNVKASEINAGSIYMGNE